MIDTSWMERARCIGEDPELFFPSITGPGNSTRAQKICADCPVSPECRAYAKQLQVSHGVWGGRARTARPTRKCPVCWRVVGCTPDGLIARHHDSIGRSTCMMSRMEYRLTEAVTA